MEGRPRLWARCDRDHARGLGNSPATSLDHDIHDVEMQSASRDLAALNAVKLGVTEKIHLVSRPKHKPRAIEMAEKMVHGTDPGTFFAIHSVQTGKENISATLDRRKGGFVGCPEGCRNLIGACQLVERIAAAPEIVGNGMSARTSITASGGAASRSW